MSLRATKWGWSQSGITSTQKLVLLDLCDRANPKNICWPKQKTIARRTRFTERAVNSALRQLEDLKLISRLKRMNGTKRTSDLITLIIDRPPAAGTSSAAPPATPVAIDASLPDEPTSGDNLNVVPKPTGTTFSEIYQDEPSRQKQTRPAFLEHFPMPDRPDLDALNHAAHAIIKLSAELGTAVDWSAPGIENLQLPAEWLMRFDEKKVASCLIAVAQRNRNFASPIRSWRYFEAEILNACQIDR